VDRANVLAQHNLSLPSALRASLLATETSSFKGAEGVMNRRNRPRRAALVLALLVLAAIVTGVAASAATTVIPRQLTGKWGLPNPQLVMVVGPRGKVNISKGAPWHKAGWYHTKFSRVTAHKHHGRLSISGPRSCSGTGTYSWKIWYEGPLGRGYQLAFTKIHDACKLRVNLWTGDNFGRNTRW